MFVCEDCHDKSRCVLNHKNYKESACCETCGKVALCYDCSGIKTFVVHVSVDAVSKERAEAIVEDCVRVGAMSECIKSDQDEVVVVLKGNTDEVEGG